MRWIPVSLQKLVGILGAALLVLMSQVPGHADDFAATIVVSRMAPASVPAGKTAYTVALPSVPDPGLVGQRADIYVRRVTNDSRVDDYKLLLTNVLVLSIPDRVDEVTAPRQATLALDPKEVKRIHKFERIGRDIVLRAATGNS